jgi:hypothetical protein
MSWNICYLGRLAAHGPMLYWHYHNLTCLKCQNHIYNRTKKLPWHEEEDAAYPAVKGHKRPKTDA